MYATPKAPHSTRKCALCNIGEDSPNVADRFTVQWINQTLSRVAPAFECPAWDGSDACCNPELGGKGDDSQYVQAVVKAIIEKYDVDVSRVYLLGIATGGFMANRLACENPEMFAGVVTFAGSTWYGVVVRLRILTTVRVNLAWLQLPVSVTTNLFNLFNELRARCHRDDDIFLLYAVVDARISHANSRDELNESQ